MPPCAGWRPCLAPRPPAWCGAWGRPARLRTTGAGACRGAGPRPASRALRGPARRTAGRSGGVRAAAWLRWAVGRRPGWWAFHAPRRAAGLRLPAPGTGATQPARVAQCARPRPLGRSARAAGESTACAFRRLPPSSRHAPCPAVSTARAMAARCRCPGPPSAGSRRWWKLPPVPTGGCAASPACRPATGAPWRAPGAGPWAQTGAGSVNRHTPPGAVRGVALVRWRLLQGLACLR